MRLVNTKLLFIFILFTFSAIFLLRYLLIGQAVYGDGIYYYAYTRSLGKDFDLNFQNELEHRYSPEGNNTLESIYPDTVNAFTETGYVANKYPIGPGIFWLPSFMAADIIANIANLLTDTFPNNGYSNIYQLFIGIFNVFCSIIGLFILYRFLLNFGNNRISQLAILALAFGSNLFYYSALDVINSHPLSFLFGSLFFYIMFCSKSKTKFALLGTISGILALIRTQDTIFLSFIFIDIILQNLDAKTKAKYLIQSVLCFILLFFIQLVSWKIVYGNFIALPYVSGAEGFDFLRPQLLGVLFNLKSGLFIWTPFYLFSLIGILKGFKRLPGTLLVFIILQLFLVSSWSGWSQGESFGIRMFISILPLFSLGFMKIIEELKTKHSILLIIFLVIYNFTAILYFLLFVQSPTFDMGHITQVRLFDTIRSLLP